MSDKELDYKLTVGEAFQKAIKKKLVEIDNEYWRWTRSKAKNVTIINPDLYNELNHLRKLYSDLNSSNDETTEILNDKILMRRLKQSISEEKEGKTRPVSELRKELSL